MDPGPHETFGLVVFEAAASGARVVACDSTPSAAVVRRPDRDLRATDVADLARAIEPPLARPDDPATAAALADRSTWPRVFEAELEALERLPR